MFAAINEEPACSLGKGGQAAELITEQQFLQQKGDLARTYEQNRLAAAEENRF